MSKLIVPFSKIVGTGNDFIFVDARQSVPHGALVNRIGKPARPHMAKFFCDRHWGIGADGLVLVEDSQTKSENLRWDFYNSDGSLAEMCGNAARCMGRWSEYFLAKTDVRFHTAAGVVHSKVEGDLVSTTLDFLNVQLKPVDLPKESHGSSAFLLNTGVPHVVLLGSELGVLKEDMKTIRMLRFHPQAGERGANVTLLAEGSSGKFESVTFERGVEDFTLSCGTGVLAAAAVAMRGSKEAIAQIETPGGNLTVEIKRVNGSITEMQLTGPAQLVFSGQIEVNL